MRMGPWNSGPECRDRKGGSTADYIIDQRASQYIWGREHIERRSDPEKKNCNDQIKLWIVKWSVIVYGKALPCWSSLPTKDDLLTIYNLIWSLHFFSGSHPRWMFPLRQIYCEAWETLIEKVIRRESFFSSSIVDHGKPKLWSHIRSLEKDWSFHTRKF